MIAKKNKKANLERKRFAFFQIGLLVSGSLCLAAFEWSSAIPEEHVEVLQDETNTIPIDIPEDEDDFIIVRPQQPKQAAVNLDNVEDITVVKKLEKTGDIALTNNKDVIIIDGDLGGDEIGIDDPVGDPAFVWEGIVDKEPAFPGGEAAMYKWLGKTIVYPEMCAEMGIQGMTVIQFVVNTDGSIVDIKSPKFPHKDLAAEGIRVVKKMPKWEAGEQAGKKVRVRYTLPINFLAPR